MGCKEGLQKAKGKLPKTYKEGNVDEKIKKIREM